MLPVVALLGPTASGKSDLALALVRRLRSQPVPLPDAGQVREAEIINSDSVQLYRGMDIGSAKTPEAARQDVPHHLLDVLPVTAEASVAEVQKMARAAVRDCRSRGVVPVVVGGSALYINAILDDLDFPPTDPDVRSRLEEEAAALGGPALHARLAEQDPAAAKAILPGNVRRIVRALEVVELTGSFTARLPAPRDGLGPTLRLGLRLPRDVLYERIASRVDRMWADGLVDEVRHLTEAGLGSGRTAAKALGYAQVLAHLQGSSSEEEARTATVVGTRRFARRQLQWWRRDDRIRWLDALDPALVSKAYDIVRDVVITS